MPRESLCSRMKLLCYNQGTPRPELGKGFSLHEKMSSAVLSATSYLCDEWVLIAKPTSSY